MLHLTSVIRYAVLVVASLTLAALMATAAPGRAATGTVLDAGSDSDPRLAAAGVPFLAPTAPIRDMDQSDAVSRLLDSTGRVTVEILHARGTEHTIRAAVDSRRGIVLGTSPGVILAKIPPVAIAALENRPGVAQVRSPLRVDLLPGFEDSSASPLDSGDIHVEVSNAAAWQDSGHKGFGVKVGIVDYFDGGAWSAAELAGALPVPAGTFCRDEGRACDVWASGTSHGVAVAEVVHDMAPRATLYLATAVTVTDLADAVRWFDDQGVQIISRSLGAQLDGPGDGTGSVGAVVDDAVDRGMAWFNAAGNHASPDGTTNGGYWRGSFVDADGDDWMEFAPGDETLGFYCGYIQGFRWSDWQATGRTDYDIGVYADPSRTEMLASSIGDQVAGEPPIEIPDGIDCSSHPVVYLGVHLYDPGSGTSTDVLEFMANQTAFEYSSNPYSATGPAGDSANPGMVTVGAIDPPDGVTIASYSSQGPTNDERIKPDLSAPSCLPTASYHPGCFNGTSAATPAAAGAAALVWGAGTATIPNDVASYLRAHAIDRGIPGTDSVYGTGQLYLGTPPPPPPNTAPLVSAGPPQTVTLPSSASLDATVTDDGLPTGSVTSTWTKTSGPGSVTFDDPSAVDTTASFSVDGVYVLTLTATDGELADFDDVTVTVNPIPNAAPVVSAGSNQTITLPGSAALNGTVTDDGLPTGSLASTWTKVSGPGAVTFNNTHAVDTTAAFSTNGVYVLRLTADDGALTDSADVTITVNPQPPPPDFFIDDDDSVFEADIEWMAAEGITKGCNPAEGNTKFCPDDRVTRGQMAAFLVR
ncbi:MAG: S8 family serine peptidase, partial [Actinomycetota bacterium]|nr:S8 family serine peptidase [Actinomycetota bacterium]